MMLPLLVKLHIKRVASAAAPHRRVVRIVQVMLGVAFLILRAVKRLPWCAPISSKSQDSLTLFVGLIPLCFAKNTRFWSFGGLIFVVVMMAYRPRRASSIRLRKLIRPVGGTCQLTQQIGQTCKFHLAF